MGLIRRFVPALACAVALAAACAPATSPAPRTPAAAAIFPGATWERIADPANAGYCADRFEAVAALATEAGTTGLMAIVGGARVV